MQAKKLMLRRRDLLVLAQLQAGAVGSGQIAFPHAYTLYEFPYRSVKNRTIACTTSGSTPFVASWSK